MYDTPGTGTETSTSRLQLLQLWTVVGMAGYTSGVRRRAEPRILAFKRAPVGLSARSAEHLRDSKHGVAGFRGVPTLPEQHLG